MPYQKLRILITTRLLYLLIVVGFVLILAKVLVLEMDKTTYACLQDSRRYRLNKYSAMRGAIYSIDPNNGELLLLACDALRYDIYLDMGKGRLSALGEKDSVGWIINDSLFKKQLKEVSLFLANNYKTKTYKQWIEYLSEQRQKQNRYTPLLKLVTPNELKALKEYKFLSKSIIAVSQYKRVYPYDKMARRTIGINIYNPNDNAPGLDGIDGAYDNYLSGEQGLREEMLIGKGLWIPVEDSLWVKPRKGKDIITTLDVSLQELASDALIKCLDSNQAESGTVILMETSTGYIKALASYRRKADSSYYEDLNIGVSSRYEPGSTFKTVTAMLLLDKGLADTGEDVPMGMRKFEGSTLPIYDVGKSEYGGEISFNRAIEISSNVGISYLTFRSYGKDRKTMMSFAMDLKNYFIYDKLQCDVNIFEPTPIISLCDNMDDLLHLSFGYTTAMTPLQLLTFYNGIANNGKMIKPLFVRAIMDRGKIIQQFDAQVIKEQMCKPSTLKTIQAMLRNVVLYGTAKRLANPSYGIAGKSGTAEINYSNNLVKSSLRQHRASFVGYFPYSKPLYSCIVVISAPKKALTHGGDLAAPVFRELSDRVMGVVASHTNFVSNVRAQNNNTQNNKYHFIDRKPIITNALNTGILPNMYGWSLRESMYCCNVLGLEVKFKGQGRVSYCSIPFGTNIKKLKTNKTIVLYLDK